MLLNDYDDILCHHGIKGQKWGVRRYQNPDGSLTPAGRERYGVHSEKVSKSVKLLNKKLNGFKYGAMVDGEIYDDLDRVPWNKYKTMTIDQMNKYKVGICWDFVNYQHDYYKKNGIPHKNYLFVKQRSEDPNDIVTHTFNIVDNGETKIWPESSWTKKKGIHSVDSFKDVCSVLDKEYGASDQPFDVYEYNADGLTGISNGDYFKRVTKSDPIYQRK